MLIREHWQSGVTYNPLSPRFYPNPYPKYAELRAKDPVHWSPLMRSWVFSRYKDIDAILRDHKRFSNDPRSRPNARNMRDSTPAAARPSMLFLDPPEHTRLRALVSKAFTPQAVEALEPRIRAIMTELLEQIEDPSAFDLLETIAAPLPVIVMAELLGVPPKDRAQFKQWSNRRARVLEPTITPAEMRIAYEAALELDAYFLDIIAQRRKEPRDDLISSLVAVEDAGDTLTHDEMLGMLRLLLIAGNETTTNLLGNGMLALLRHPDQLQWLRDHPEHMPTAIEELLRYDSPVQIDGRTVLEDTEVAGRRLHKGQSVVLLMGAGNRDPEVFSNPEQLHLMRKESPHIAFGRGIHHCLGAPLARAEGRIAFTALLERFNELQLLTPQPHFRDNIVLRGLRSLPLRAKSA
jgi:cytochrome P450